nr:MAG TPA: hypothetical protein [Bacteriophage sp.]
MAVVFSPSATDKSPIAPLLSSSPILFLVP